MPLSLLRPARPGQIAPQASQGSHPSAVDLGRHWQIQMADAELRETQRIMRSGAGLLPTQELHLVYVLTRWIVNGPANTAPGISAQEVRGFLVHRLRDAVVGRRLPRIADNWSPILEANVRQLLFEQLPVEGLPEQELTLVGLLISTILNHGPANAARSIPAAQTLENLRRGLYLVLSGERIPNVNEQIPNVNEQELEAMYRERYRGQRQRSPPRGSPSRSRSPRRLHR